MKLPVILCSLVAALALAGPAASAAPATPTPTPTGVRGHTEVIGDCQHATQTPRQVISACGDLNSVAVITHYDSWTGHQARGAGVFKVNPCTPDCAHGTLVRYPATFGLHRVVTTKDGTRLFTRLGITYVENGEQHDVTLVLPTAPVG